MSNFNKGDLVHLKGAPLEYAGEIICVDDQTNPTLYWVEGENIAYFYSESELEKCPKS